MAPPGTTLVLLDEAQALAALILPVAPRERPSTTPRLTIDALLARLALGERPALELSGRGAGRKDAGAAGED